MVLVKVVSSPGILITWACVSGVTPHPSHAEHIAASAGSRGAPVTQLKVIHAPGRCDGKAYMHDAVLSLAIATIHSRLPEDVGCLIP